ncbi:MAG: GatB/YqeY domain-containing protein [Nitrospirales bacterium]
MTAHTVEVIEMSLDDQLLEDLRQAMRSKEQLRVNVIRMMKAAIQTKQLDLKRELDDAELTKVMTTLIKQGKEAAELYSKAKRDDLAAKELQEIGIIERYLPQAVSEEELVQVIRTVVEETAAQGLKDLGTVMKTLMARLAGRPVDGKRASELVRGQLQ